MKPLAWIPAVLALLVVALWWRQSDLQDQLTETHAALNQLHAELERRPAHVAVPSRPSENLPSLVDAGFSRIGVATKEGESGLAERMAELEQVVSGQADIIEGMLSTVSAWEAQRRKANARSWGPEQAVGAPDTMAPGDHATAWAPASADGGVEWIEASFASPAEAAQVIVRQTSNPGAIVRVVAILEGGSEVPIWSGQDPSKGQQLADTPFSIPAGVRAAGVRVYLDTSKLPGWEEIDAFQLVGRDGSRQWANSVNASSTYASGARLTAERLTLDQSISAQPDTFLHGLSQ